MAQLGRQVDIAVGCQQAETAMCSSIIREIEPQRALGVRANCLTSASLGLAACHNGGEGVRDRRLTGVVVFVVAAARKAPGALLHELHHLLLNGACKKPWTI
jgi:hypothetical protein